MRKQGARRKRARSWKYSSSRPDKVPKSDYKLLIVESPTKAKTIQKYLGADFVVASTMGHVMDLPKKGFGVDLNTFKPNYQLIPGKRRVVTYLKSLLKGASEVYIGTDPDREGEAIAFHLSQLLSLKSPKRIEIREVTPEGLRRALEKPRPIDLGLVLAQTTRRVLDRLLGYTLSPLLWRALKRTALSAGRVQSVGLKLICEREREILNFIPETYYTLELTFSLIAPSGEEMEVKALLMKGDEPIRFKEPDKELERKLRSTPWELSYEISEKEVLPPPPLITSSLQGECSKLGLSAGRTMRIAQSLFEGVDLPSGRIGLITYHRTDSFRVSEAGVKLAKEILSFTFGDDWFTYRNYKPRAGAQDAHEAIRPTTSTPPEALESVLPADHLKVYSTVWKRFLAAFSPSLSYFLQVLNFKPKGVNLKGTFTYKAGKVKRKGFSEILGLPAIDALKREWVDEEFLRPVEIKLKRLTWKKGKTKPPSRYTQASLIKTLERLGVGRPSTYATIIETLLKRGYAQMKRKFMVPTELGMKVNDYLQKYFSDLINESFTAKMEEGLDRIEESQEPLARELSYSYLKEFWDSLSRRVSEVKMTSRERNS